MYGTKQSKTKRVGPAAPDKHTRYVSEYIRSNKVFAAENPPHIKFSSNPPGGENKKDFQQPKSFSEDHSPSCVLGTSCAIYHSLEFLEDDELYDDEEEVWDDGEELVEDEEEVI